MSRAGVAPRPTRGGLVRVSPDVDAGFHRVRAGAGFRYTDDAGDAVSNAVRERIVDLVIPPAWTDVWIAGDARGHIQAVGTDADGRRQYLYHPLWRARRDRGKFARALDLAAALPAARRRVTAALRREGLGRDTVLAAAFRLLDAAAPRVGSTRYLLRHGSRGLTTLRRGDVTIAGSTITLSFPAKSGQRARIELDDADLAVVLTLLAAGRPRASLLSYAKGRRRVALTPQDVNETVRSLTGGKFTAKDFRTLRGTIVAAQELAVLGPAGSARDRRRVEQEAVAATARVLGNTPTVARSSYIDPRVFRRYAAGDLLDLAGSPEAALVRLLRPPPAATAGPPDAA